MPLRSMRTSISSSTWPLAVRMAGSRTENRASRGSTPARRRRGISGTPEISGTLPGRTRASCLSRASRCGSRRDTTAADDLLSTPFSGRKTLDARNLATAHARCLMSGSLDVFLWRGGSFTAGCFHRYELHETIDCMYYT